MRRFTLRRQSLLYAASGEDVASGTYDVRKLMAVLHALMAAGMLWREL